jgi:hypothetical protein
MDESVSELLWQINMAEERGAQSLGCAFAALFVERKAK